jgi:RNA polymerase sigma-70 factor (ECF subfamily)
VKTEETTMKVLGKDVAGVEGEGEATQARAFDLARIARVYGDTLYRKALRLARDPDGAWDLLQETYERTLRARPGCVSDAQALAWLGVVMRNYHCDQLRSRRGRRQVENQILEQIPVAEPDPAPAWAELTMAEIEARLPAISASLRPVYQMHALEGRSYDEIAARLNLCKVTVGTRLLRARRQLRRALDADNLGAAA